MTSDFLKSFFQKSIWHHHTVRQETIALNGKQFTDH